MSRTESSKQLHATAPRFRICVVLLALLLAILPNQAMASGAGFKLVDSPSVSGQFNVLRSISAVSSTDIWAVGNSGNDSLIEHWDGNSWTIVPGGRLRFPYSVAAIGRNDVWTVGAWGAEHWNGSTWTEVNPIPKDLASSAAFLSVSARASNDVWAVGGWQGPYGAFGTTNPIAAHWDGHAWRPVLVPFDGSYGGELYGVTAVGPGEAWAVGNSTNAYLVHCIATACTKVTNTSATGLKKSMLYSVSGTSPTDVWAVGCQASGTAGCATLVQHYDGKKWTVVPSPSVPSPGYNVLGAVFAVNSSDVWAVGQSSTSAGDALLAQHFDGTSWTAVPTAWPSNATQDARLLGITSVNGYAWTVGTTNMWGPTSETLIERHTSP